MKLTGPEADDYRRDERSDYRFDGRCRHWTRAFIDYPEEPTQGQRVKFKCIECGKTKEMTI